MSIKMELVAQDAIAHAYSPLHIAQVMMENLRQLESSLQKGLKYDFSELETDLNGQLDDRILETKEQLGCSTPRLRWRAIDGCCMRGSNLFHLSVILFSSPSKATCAPHLISSSIGMNDSSSSFAESSCLRWAVQSTPERLGRNNSGASFNPGLIFFFYPEPTFGFMQLLIAMRDNRSPCLSSRR